MEGYTVLHRHVTLLLINLPVPGSPLLHYSRMEDRGRWGKPRPDLPEEPTAEQIERTYWGFTANSGTYEATESTITFIPIVAKSPNMTNAPRPYSMDYKFEGESLIIYLPSAKLPVPIELKYTRLE